MKELLQSIGQDFLGMFQKLIDSATGGKSHDYSASFGRESSFMSTSADGFSVTGNKQMTLEESCTHLAVISPSGGGKTTCNILGTVLRQTRSSLLINDNSKEIRAKSSNYLRSVGYDVGFLDFDVEQFTTETAFYNPLSRCNSKADIAKLVSILVKQSSSDNGNDKFWTISASEVISLAIERVLCEPDPKAHHLASVYSLLQLMIAEEDRITFDLAAHDDLFMRWNILLSNSSNTKASIFSSAIAALSWIDTNPNLALLTSRDSISFSEMRKSTTAIFISVPLAYEEVYMPLVNCFYAQFFSSILESPLPKKKDLPILALLDEFGSSMHIPGYNKYASNMRKWHVSLLAILQSEFQLDKYGKAEAKEILSSCSKIYFTGLDDEAERVSRLLGKYSYKDNKEQNRERLLMTPEEVRTMPKNRCIVVPNGGRKPIYAKLVPFYEQRTLVKRSQIVSEDDDRVKVVTPEFNLISISELPKELRDEV